MFYPSIKCNFPISSPYEHKSTNSSIFTNSLIKQVHSGFIYQYQLLSAPQKEILHVFSSPHFYASYSYSHCHILFYSDSLKHHSVSLPMQHCLLISVMCTFFFLLIKPWPAQLYSWNIKPGVLIIFFQSFLPKHITYYFPLETYIIFFHPSQEMPTNMPLGVILHYLIIKIHIRKFRAAHDLSFESFSDNKKLLKQFCDVCFVASD